MAQQAAPGSVVAKRMQMHGSLASQALRDLAMGLVQAFPAEHRLLTAARITVKEREQSMFATVERT